MSDSTLPPPPQSPPPPQPQGRPCVSCGSATLVGREQQLTRKRRVKFGFTWLLVTILTGGVGLILWLIWPRTTEVIGVDRYTECTTCGTRQ